jgi:hypothetical protein
MPPRSGIWSRAAKAKLVISETGVVAEFGFVTASVRQNAVFRSMVWPSQRGSQLSLSPTTSGGPAAGTESPTLRTAWTPSEVLIRGWNRVASSGSCFNRSRRGFRICAGKTHAVTAFELVNCGVPKERLDTVAADSLSNSKMVASRSIPFAGPSRASFKRHTHLGKVSTIRSRQVGCCVAAGMGNMMMALSGKRLRNAKKPSAATIKRDKAIVDSGREGGFILVQTRGLMPDINSPAGVKLPEQTHAGVDWLPISAASRVRTRTASRTVHWRTIRFSCNFF